MHYSLDNTVTKSLLVIAHEVILSPTRPAGLTKTASLHGIDDDVLYTAYILDQPPAPQSQGRGKGSDSCHV